MEIMTVSAVSEREEEEKKRKLEGEMMMMIGDHPRSNPTVHIPAWDPHYFDDQTAHIKSPISHDATHHYETALMALQRFLPSNNAEEDGGDEEDFDFPVDAFSCDNFRMFDFKVKKCALASSHDWTACPFAHPGEKARRRDPRKYHYSGSACPDFRKGACRKGDTCEYAHGVFECWLHPARYRTQSCKDGTHCRRRVCFFAHTPEQLRVLPYSSTSPEASPGRYGKDPFGMVGSSPKSALYSPPPSPPAASSSQVSPSGAISVRQLAGAMRCLQINKMKLGLSLSGSPPSWGFGVVSPRSPPEIRPGFLSLPSTPIRAHSQNPRGGLNSFEPWGTPPCEEEPAMERVESGQELRERIYAKLGKENSLDGMGLLADSTLGSGHYPYGLVIS